MRTYILIFAVTLAPVLLIGCYNEKSRENFSGRQDLNDEITREYYEVFGAGVWGEVKADYLTDSITFRIFIGTRDESQNYYYEVNGDTIKVELMNYDRAKAKVDSTFYFRIKELKANPEYKIQ